MKQLDPRSAQDVLRLLRRGLDERTANRLPLPGAEGEAERDYYAERVNGDDLAVVFRRLDTSDGVEHQRGYLVSRLLEPAEYRLVIAPGTGTPLYVNPIYGRASAHQGLGQVALARGDLVAAEDNFQAALRLLNEGDDTVGGAAAST